MCHRNESEIKIKQCHLHSASPSSSGPSYSVFSYFRDASLLPASSTLACPDLQHNQSQTRTVLGLLKSPAAVTRGSQSLSNGSLTHARTHTRTRTSSFWVPPLPSFPLMSECFPWILDIAMAYCYCVFLFSSPSPQALVTVVSLSPPASLAILSFFWAMTLKTSSLTESANVFSLYRVSP